MKRVWIVWGVAALILLIGIVWKVMPDKAGFFIVESVHDLFEIFGAIATVVTAVVAVIALTSWEAQFRHVEKFKAIRLLLEASSDIQKMRPYLFKLQEKYVGLLASDGAPDEAVNSQETILREQWFDVQDKYSKAWVASSVFLSEKERASIPLTGDVLRRMSFDLPMELTFYYANAGGYSGQSAFIFNVRDVIDNYCEQAETTIAAIEKIFTSINQPK